MCVSMCVSIKVYASKVASTEWGLINVLQNENGAVFFYSNGTVFKPLSFPLFRIPNRPHYTEGVSLSSSGTIWIGDGVSRLHTTELLPQPLETPVPDMTDCVWWDVKPSSIYLLIPPPSPGNFIHDCLHTGTTGGIPPPALTHFFMHSVIVSMPFCCSPLGTDAPSVTWPAGASIIATTVTLYTTAKSRSSSLDSNDHRLTQR